jgi:hypothetical protein
MAKKNQAKNDVARRLSGIKHLFAAAEPYPIGKSFDVSDRGVPVVPEVDALEEVASFGHITKEVEQAIARAVTAFGGYSEAQFGGDIRGAASEVHADVRALTNVALGLSPPSRDFYDKVLGGLVEVEHDGSPPRDAGRVPYPPLRVSVEEIEKYAQNGRGSGGLGAALSRDAFSVGAFLTPELLKTLIGLQNKVVSTYIDKIGKGASKVAGALTTPLAQAANELTTRAASFSTSPNYTNSIENFKSTLGDSATYSPEVDQGMAAIELAFQALYAALTK